VCGRACICSRLMQAADCTRPARRMLINLRPDNGGKRSARPPVKKNSRLFIVWVASRGRRRRLICRPSGFTVGKVAHNTKVYKNGRRMRIAKYYLDLALPSVNRVTRERKRNSLHFAVQYGFYSQQWQKHLVLEEKQL
jgi:isocitrate/isopropylmalate dehydrogenase